MQIKVNTFRPSSRLQPFIHSFLIIESAFGTENKVLPDNAIVAAFCFRGQVEYRENASKISIPAMAITGQKRSYRHIHYSPGTSTLLVKFQPAGVSAFFNTPPNEFFDTTISLDSLIGITKVDHINEKLASAPDDPTRIAVIEEFLFRQYREPKSDALVEFAIKKIVETNGAIKIHELADAVHLSQDPFEKRFRKIAGATPKQFSEVVRWRAVIKSYSPGTQLTGLALQAGFFDQAHFTNRFRSFTGQAPRHFFKEPAYW